MFCEDDIHVLRDSCMIVDWFDKHDLAWSPAPASGGPERTADVYS